MRREIGLGMTLLGALLLVSGALRLIPSACMVLMGLLLLGLSFVPAHEPEAGASPELHFFEKLSGIFYAPATVFRNLRTHPEWASAFCVMALCAGLYTLTFIKRLTPEVVAVARIDRVIDSGYIPEDKIEALRSQEIEDSRSAIYSFGSVVFTCASLFASTLLTATLYLFGVVMVGGRLNIWQSLAVTVYAFLPPTVMQHMLSLLLLFIKPPDTIDPFIGQQGIVVDNLSILFNAGEHPFLYTLAASVGVFTVYKLWLVKTGLRYTSGRVSSTAAWAVALAVWALGLAFSLLGALLNPHFAF